jgi:hypothetical protein
MPVAHFFHCCNAFLGIKQTAREETFKCILPSDNAENFFLLFCRAEKRAVHAIAGNRRQTALAASFIYFNRIFLFVLTQIHRSRLASLQAWRFSLFYTSLIERLECI